MNYDKYFKKRKIFQTARIICQKTYQPLHVQGRGGGGGDISYFKGTATLKVQLLLEQFLHSLRKFLCQ